MALLLFALGRLLLQVGQIDGLEVVCATAAHLLVAARYESVAHPLVFACLLELPAGYTVLVKLRQASFALDRWRLLQWRLSRLLLLAHRLHSASPGVIFFVLFVSVHIQVVLIGRRALLGVNEPFLVHRGSHLIVLLYFFSFDQPSLKILRLR